MSHALPISLYIHWPFCARTCPYCDYNSHMRAHVDQEAWRDALLQELDYYAQKTKGCQLVSIFFGGGTPSLMPAATVQALIDAALKHWPAAPHFEITLEANPTHLPAHFYEDMRTAGVNRLSLGIQALDADALTFLGRDHTVSDARRAMVSVAKTFDRYSFDLMYARPHQSLDQWAVELESVLEMKPSHLSCYMLTIEENTPFYQQYQRGDFVVPTGEQRAAFYALTNDMCADAGLRGYEVSSYGLSDHACRHNLHYWTYGAYIGIGPGAHGRYMQEDKRYAACQIKGPEKWLKAVHSHGHGTDSMVPLSWEAQRQELLLLGLRLYVGISHETCRRVLGIALEDLCDPDTVQSLEREELIILDPQGLRCTSKGRHYLEAMIDELI